jgi:hypothetical protein
MERHIAFVLRGNELAHPQSSGARLMHKVLGECEHGAACELHLHPFEPDFHGFAPAWPHLFNGLASGKYNLWDHSLIRHSVSFGSFGGRKMKL